MTLMIATELLRNLRFSTKRFKVTCIDALPEYMKFVYKIFLDSYVEMEEIMASEGKAYQIEYAKDLMKELSRHYLIEAILFFTFLAKF
ncbi:putative (-)-beta-caryophyllene synthase [Helianthus anomalus]